MPLVHTHLCQGPQPLPIELPVRGTSNYVKGAKPEAAILSPKESGAWFALLSNHSSRLLCSWQNYFKGSAQLGFQCAQIGQEYLQGYFGKNCQVDV